MPSFYGKRCGAGFYLIMRVSAKLDVVWPQPNDLLNFARFFPNSDPMARNARIIRTAGICDHVGDDVLLCELALNDYAEAVIFTARS